MAESLPDLCEMVVVMLTSHESQSIIRWPDSLIIAAALLVNCKTQFFDDIQHGQGLDSHLTCSIPFFALGHCGKKHSNAS